VPEFCPGKRIPENILINYVGKQNVQGATIEAILKKTLPHAVSSIGDLVVLDIFATTVEEDESKALKIPSVERK
ncbi:uncharacterized protein A4U43_C04F25800, partial [Asparagus officinalis]